MKRSKADTENHRAAQSYTERRFSLCVTPSLLCAAVRNFSNSIIME